jgi:hypothetical protein
MTEATFFRLPSSFTETQYLLMFRSSVQNLLKKMLFFVCYFKNSLFRNLKVYTFAVP